MDALGIFSLAAQLQVNMILDDRRDGHRDASADEYVLGPGYARLIGNRHVTSQFMNKIVCFLCEGYREPFAILVLTDMGRAESFAQLATSACADRIVIQVIQAGGCAGNTSERTVHGASESH
jgi:hypothetical protein